MKAKNVDLLNNNGVEKAKFKKTDHKARLWVILFIMPEAGPPHLGFIICLNSPRPIY